MYIQIFKYVSKIIYVSCLFNILNISFIYIKISTFYLQDSNFLLVFYLPWLTQHSIFSTQVLSCAHAVEPTFLTAVQSFQGGSTA